MPFLFAYPKIFDEHFNYKRRELEKFENQNILKNGSPLDKLEVNKKIEIESINKDNELFINEKSLQDWKINIQLGDTLSSLLSIEITNNEDNILKKKKRLKR